MPTLRFHAIEASFVQQISDAMVKDLAACCQIPEDHFNLEVMHSSFFEGGDLVTGFPLVEVHAFKRPEEVEDVFAQIVSRYLSVKYADHELYFIHLHARHYYGNGTHY